MYYSQGPSSNTSIGDKWLSEKVNFNLPVSMDIHIAADILNAHRNAYIFPCKVHTQRHTNLDKNGRISTFWCIFPRNWWERWKSDSIKKSVISITYLIWSLPNLHLWHEPLHGWPHFKLTLHGTEQAANSFKSFSPSEHLMVTVWPHGDFASTISSHVVLSHSAPHAPSHLWPQPRFFVQRLWQYASDGLPEQGTRTMCWHSFRSLSTGTVQSAHFSP